MNLPRDVLYKRHRLSHQQIDDLLGENSGQLVLEEKVSQLGKIAEFIEITSRLDDAGIWFIPCKGPLLSYRIYGDATYRIFKDFDLLVKTADISDTIRILQIKGYISDTIEWPELGHQRNRLVSKVNQISLVHPEKGTSVEIHWRLHNIPAIGFRLIEKALAQHIQPLIFNGKRYILFTPEFELLYLIIHGGRHTWTRLKWLLDIHEIIKRVYIDKNKFEQLVRLFKAERMTGLCNAMLRHFFPGSKVLPFDYPFPEWFLSFSVHQATRVSDVPFILPEDFSRFNMYHIQTFPDWNYQRISVWKFLILLLLRFRRKLVPRRPVR